MFEVENYNNRIHKIGKVRGNYCEWHDTSLGAGGQGRQVEEGGSTKLSFV